MDKNSITGLVLITAILGLFWWINQPSEEQQRAMERRLDSLKQVELVQQETARKAADEADIAEAAKTQQAEAQDSLQRNINQQQKYGLFAEAAEGTQEFITLENNLVKVTLSNKGARIYSVELKDYKTHDGLPLVLFNGDQNRFGFAFNHNNRVFHTNDLFFRATKKGTKQVDLSLTPDTEESITFSYDLPDNSYTVNFGITSKDMTNVISTPRGGIDLEWDINVPAQEKGTDFERRYAGVYYKFYQDEVDHISSAKSSSEDLRTKVKWVAFKDQFFSSVLIADEYFSGGNVSATAPEDKTSRSIMNATAQLSIPFTGNDHQTFKFFFGPNDFKVLTEYKDIDLRKLVYLGWGFLRYINLGVIEVFHFFEGFISNYGLIILLLTILIKLILFPLTYKSYVSSAKMRVLKPQIEEINNKIPKEKAMERQQATMALYRKAGVNPMGGCLPMLLQMPILFAMFQFFPASIELRQESFLWATDLSSYDSIFDLPFNIPMYGDHVSLFCLLMAFTNIFYTRMNQDMAQSSQQMPGMKGMMYMMPLMFLVFFNNYASGLSYYYFISTLITIGQTVLIRRFVDEKTLLAKLNANKKKISKKSKFQQRLEDMARQQKQLNKKRR